MIQSLPTGRRGRMLAMALTLLAALVLWRGAVAPLADWYAARTEALAARMALAAHMQAIAARLPELRRIAASIAAPAPALLEGNSDALAAARLQELVGGLASEAGATPTSLETLPSEQRGSFRRVGIRITLAAPWPHLVSLMAAIEQAHPRMLLDDLELRGVPARSRNEAEPVSASFAVYAFRGAAP